MTAKTKVAKPRAAATTKPTIHRTNLKLGQTKMEKMRVFNYLALPSKLAVAYAIKHQSIQDAKSRETALSWLTDGTCPTVAVLRQGATGWKSMHALYNWHQLPETPLHAKFLEWAWLNSRQAQAIRNRFRLVVKELEESLKEQHQSGKSKIKLYSLAGGSGQSAFEAASRFPDPEKLELYLLDKDKTALEQSYKLAREDFKLTNKLELLELDVLAASPEELKEHQAAAQVIEMIGLMDYLQEEENIEALTRAFSILEEDGDLITAHIHPNEEKILLEKILEWAPMDYKTPTHFKKILENHPSGKIHQFKTEPHRIHSVARLKKNPSTS